MGAAKREPGPLVNTRRGQWLKYYLPSIGVLEDVTKPKHNMEPVDLDRVIQAIWCDLKYSHE